MFIILVIAFVIHEFCDADAGKVVYVLTGAIEPCDDPNRDTIDISKVKVLTNGKFEQFLDGPIHISNFIKSPIKVNVEVFFKENKEYTSVAMLTVDDLCSETVYKKNMSWTPFFDQLTNEEKTCPLKPNTINITTFMIGNPDFLLDDQTMGSYKANLQLTAPSGGEPKNMLCVNVPFELKYVD